MARFRGVTFLAAVAIITLGALLARSPSTQAVSSSITVPRSPDVLPGATPEPSAAQAEEPTLARPPAPATPMTVPPTPFPGLEARAAGDLSRDTGPDGRPEADPSLQTTMEWSPPPLPVPLARHPFDHYWFLRPVRSNHINTGLLRYLYGSDGSKNDLRVHHGIDISNPTGTEVVAVAAGVVAEAGMGHFNEWESITSYGNVVSIEHDMGYQGKKLYTLYAHLSEILVQPGQRVEAGQVIGLVGSTGASSGPHVHFEVRLERNAWRSVRNPDLWLAPYTGTGTIASRIAFASGAPAHNVEVVVVDRSTGRVMYRTTTYADGSVSPDDRWNENFVLPNVPLGRYELTASYGALRWVGDVQVQEGLTNWVDMTLEESRPGDASADG